MITKDLAEAFFDNTITDSQLSDLNLCLITYGIDQTKARLNHFLSQIAHESGGLQWLAEIADGSDYEWRSDLGNTRVGDGCKYKGAGVIQLTGRANYQDFATYIKDSRVMEGWTYVSEVYPFTSAGFWWMNNRMNARIDDGATVVTEPCRSVEQVTRIVNGGYNGLDDRLDYYFKAVELTKDVPTPFKQPISDFINRTFSLGQ